MWYTFQPMKKKLRWYWSRWNLIFREKLYQTWASVFILTCRGRLVVLRDLEWCYVKRQGRVCLREFLVVLPLKITSSMVRLLQLLHYLLISENDTDSLAYIGVNSVSDIEFKCHFVSCLHRESVWQRGFNKQCRWTYGKTAKSTAVEQTPKIQVPSRVGYWTWHLRVPSSLHASPRLVLILHLYFRFFKRQFLKGFPSCNSVYISCHPNLTTWLPQRNLLGITYWKFWVIYFKNEYPPLVFIYNFLFFILVQINWSFFFL